MARSIVTLLTLSLAVVAGWLGVRHFEDSSHQANVQELRQQVAAEKQKNELLRGLIDRLRSDKRVARLSVLEQTTGPDGKVETTLAFNQYDRNGKALLEESRTVRFAGTGAHIDAQVVQFEDEFVDKNDPAKGHAIALFTRVFGHDQPVASGYTLASAGDPPGAEPGVDPKTAKIERELWQEFWKLTESAELRKRWNVKNASGVGTYHEDFKPGFYYVITLDPQGGMKMSTVPWDNEVWAMYKHKKAG